MKTKDIGFDAVGNSLLEHARGAELTARGVVEGLFPYIVQASRRMSSRAISQFLEKEHGMKISFVSIGNALRNPGRYWNRYFDAIEAHAWIVAEVHSAELRSFMSDGEKYHDLLETEKVYPIEGGGTREENEASAMRSMADYEEAVRVLDEKWFCFDDAVLEDARMHLLGRFTTRPQGRDEDEGEE